MPPVIRVYLIAGSPLAAEAISARLAGGREIHLAGATTSWAEAESALPGCGIDVVVIDASAGALPATLGRTRELGERHPDLKLLPLGLPDPGTVLRFLEAGAAGYTLRDDSLDRVLATIAGVATGRAPCAPGIAALVAARIAELARRRPWLPEMKESLSSRENEVLRLLAAGLRNKEIARRLGVALSTARNHVQKVLEKLEVHRRRDAVRRAAERGLLDGPPSLQPARAGF